MKSKPIVLITEPISDPGIQALKESCEVLTPWANGRTFSEAELREAEGIIVRLVTIDAALLSKAPNLKVIGRHGVGFDNVDTKAATLRGIPVVFTPLNANAVAEHAVHLMMALARNTVGADKAVRENHFRFRDSFVGFELRHKTLGVVGLGAIGSRVAEICRNGFDMRVIAFDPFVANLDCNDQVRFANSLFDLLQEADVATLHVPLTTATRHLIDGSALGRMKPTAFLVNTARGSIVDTLALTDALTRGLIRGAALDVFEEEPLPAGDPILTAPNTLFSPHIASSTQGAREEMSRLVAKQVVQVLRGERPEFLANPEVLVSL